MVPMPTTASQLAKVQAAHEAALRRYEGALAARDDAIRQAVEDGWTQTQIAEAMGLTRGRVGQLVSRMTR
jgi:DNA-directed RNA polymerase specialized sigma24 family protein